MNRPLFTNIIAVFLMLAAVASMPSEARTASKSGETARAIPTGVFEVLVGGAWEHQEQSGYYRAIAMAAGDPGKEYAEVWLQWISVDDKSANILQNIAIEEITKLNLPSLTLEMDIEDAGSIILIVTHFDENTDEPTNLEFRATQPGKYEALEAQVGKDDTGDSEASEQN